MFKLFIVVIFYSVFALEASEIRELNKKRITAPCSAEMQDFWKKFRDDVLNNKLDEVVKVVRFPFPFCHIIGQQHNVISNSAQFKKTFSKLLNVNADELFGKMKVMLKIVEDTNELSPFQCSDPSGKRFKVGNWLFDKNNKWQFVLSEGFDDLSAEDEKEFLRETGNKEIKLNWK